LTSQCTAGGTALHSHDIRSRLFDLSADSDALNLKTIRSEQLEATLNALVSGVYLGHSSLSWRSSFILQVLGYNRINEAAIFVRELAPGPILNKNLLIQQSELPVSRNRQRNAAG
jgi:hypothetical protein